MAGAAPPRKADPEIRTIAVSDIVEAFAEGLRDFLATPLYGLFFGGIYALGGMAIALTVFALDLGYLSYPLAAGFALIGPFIAVGLYEVSRRRETETPLSWRGVLAVVIEQRNRELGWMAFVTMFMLIIWMYQVRILVAVFFGLKAPSAFNEFLTLMVTTPEGLMFLLVGHVVGGLLALVMFALTVVSFPLLLDREVDFITAMITSVRSVAKNPRPMLGWAATIVVLLIIAMAPFFLGLFLVLPILGHTTWHVYKRIVEPVASAGQQGDSAGR